ncbi:hypothetical protein P168DRAFT_18462 [Aspergillus campestris IBT 28561]|uniref:Uncharacterized protein n=1 Tax=Aspergillus campestris (strain IBT 28561) TaxID=1392248 RepID=A0A2I1DF97_ASPC2|nr:uncharacterized protein P168DRAFT_18462 [Aspergillus campestris IBT 28561]PKY08552.1 hypothetical protein P168DRAFT_18462 [Aspergillus campestris IBT 28561]
MRGERDAARRVVVKYHRSSGDVNEAIIGMTVSQIEDSFGSYRIEPVVCSFPGSLVSVHGSFLYSFSNSGNSGGIITSCEISLHLPFLLLFFSYLFDFAFTFPCHLAFFFFFLSFLFSFFFAVK